MWRYQTPGLAARQVTPPKGLSYYWHLTGNPHSMITEIMSLSNEVCIFSELHSWEKKLLLPRVFTNEFLGCPLLLPHRLTGEELCKNNQNVRRFAQHSIINSSKLIPACAKYGTTLKHQQFLATKKRWGGR